MPFIRMPDFLKGAITKLASLRQHYLDQVQRVCRAPAQHSQPSRPLVRTTGWLPCNSEKLGSAGTMVKNEKEVARQACNLELRPGESQFETFPFSRSSIRPAPKSFPVFPKAFRR